MPYKDKSFDELLDCLLFQCFEAIVYYLRNSLTVFVTFESGIAHERCGVEDSFRTFEEQSSKR